MTSPIVNTTDIPKHTYIEYMTSPIVNKPILFTIGEVMYCICVLGDISFIYYWRSHVLYMCVRGYQFIYYWRSHVLHMCVRGYQFYVNKTDIP
jgi:hypothetical protein